jgi:hypothetical protein
MDTGGPSGRGDQEHAATSTMIKVTLRSLNMFVSMGNTLISWQESVNPDQQKQRKTDPGIANICLLYQSGRFKSPRGLSSKVKCEMEGK